MNNEENLKAVSHSDELTIGDLLLRRKSMVMHVGIYLGNDSILHNTPKAGEHQVDFATFANGKPVFAKASGLQPDEVLRKARQILAAPADYRLFKHNCEHTANSIINNHPNSRQLSEITAWALIGGAFGKSVGKKSMYIGGFIGALGGLLSLPRMWWIK
jgi:cell wall-associated NlpC family hydrolase